jgi:hypothetical protein
LRFSEQFKKRALLELPESEEEVEEEEEEDLTIRRIVCKYSYLPINAT